MGPGRVDKIRHLDCVYYDRCLTTAQRWAGFHCGACALSPLPPLAQEPPQALPVLVEDREEPTPEEIAVVAVPSPSGQKVDRYGYALEQCTCGLVRRLIDGLCRRCHIRRRWNLAPLPAAKRSGPVSS